MVDRPSFRLNQFMMQKWDAKILKYIDSCSENSDKDVDLSISGEI